MGLKRGYIVEEDTPRADAVRIRRFRLSNGDRVYLPLDVASFILTRHSPAEEFFFVEKGLLGRTAWAGTLHEVRVALANGTLSPGDIKGLHLPAQDAPSGWNPMTEEDDHSRVGAKIGPLAATMRANGRPETAEAMTVDAWVTNATSEGACAAERADGEHGHVRCGHNKGHTGNHEPLCPECDIVKQIMYAMAESASAWGR